MLLRREQPRTMIYFRLCQIYNRRPGLKYIGRPYLYDVCIPLLQFIACSYTNDICLTDAMLQNLTGLCALYIED